MAIAALDLGRRRIGVAVTDAAAMGSHPVGIVERRALKADLGASVAEALGVNVEMFDERLTSFEARERLSEMPVRKGARKTGLDALAAVVILEGWLHANPDKI